MKRTAWLVIVGLCALSLFLVVGCNLLNQPPVAAFNVSATEIAPFVEVMFDATGSHDPDGEIVEYRWAFGDGRDGEGAVVTQSYPGLGTFRVILTVRDDQGATATAERTISVIEPPVENQPPVARFMSSPLSPRAGEEVVFDATGTQDDGVIVEYWWDFGDGEGATGQVVRHTFAEPETYLVLLIVVDAFGAEGEAEAEITVR